ALSQAAYHSSDYHRQKPQAIAALQILTAKCPTACSAIIIKCQTVCLITTSNPCLQPTALHPFLSTAQAFCKDQAKMAVIRIYCLTVNQQLQPCLRTTARVKQLHQALLS